MKVSSIIIKLNSDDDIEKNDEVTMNYNPRAKKFESKQAGRQAGRQEREANKR